MHQIHDVARLTGLTSSVLRIWELRYGWPKPQRGPNGYRSYPSWLVNDLVRVKALLDTGTPLGEIIKDGEVYFPTVVVDRTPKVVHDFSAIPLPRTKQGKDIRSLLEDAIITGNEGAIAECMAQLPIIHPLDRGPAIRDVLTAAGRIAP